MERDGSPVFVGLDVAMCLGMIVEMQGQQPLRQRLQNFVMPTDC